MPTNYEQAMNRTIIALHEHARMHVNLFYLCVLVLTVWTMRGFIAFDSREILGTAWSDSLVRMMHSRLLISVHFTFCRW